jgi:hypothetical protein
LKSFDGALHREECSLMLAHLHSSPRYKYEPGNLGQERFISVEHVATNVSLTKKLATSSIVNNSISPLIGDEKLKVLN